MLKSGGAHRPLPNLARQQDYAFLQGPCHFEQGGQNPLCNAPLDFEVSGAPTIAPSAPSFCLPADNTHAHAQPRSRLVKQPG